MSDANRHMDDQFRRMSEELQANYRKDYWEEASRLMENDSLDQAFQDAASAYTAAEVGGMEIASESLGEAFMDEAFRDAAKQVSIPYESAFWNELEANRSDIEMNDAFHQASGAVKAQYSPAFWGDADAALQKEGLHYEYKSAYWNEARDLLDKADRRSFFYRWSGIAALLLLISFVGLNEAGSDSFVKQTRGIIGDHEASLVMTSIDSETPVSEQLESDKNEFEDFTNTDHVDIMGQNSQLERSALADESADSHEDEILADESIPESQTKKDEDEEQEVDDIADDSSISYERNDSPDIAIVPGEDTQLVVINEFDNNLMNVGIAESYENAPLRIAPLPFSVRKIEQNHATRLPFGASVIEKSPNLKRHNLAIIGRVGLGKSYGFEAITTTPRYSAGLEYSFNGSGALRNFEFGVNSMLNYSTHENVRKEIKVDSFLIDGSSKNYWVSLRVFDLFYVNTNAFVNYRIGLKHKLRFGAGIERLAMVQSNMSYKIGDDTGLETVNNNWGVKRGIAKWDARFTLGYEYRLNKSLSMNINGAFGLADRTANDFYSIDQINDREMNIMFGVKYNLLTRIR